MKKPSKTCAFLQHILRDKSFQLPALTAVIHWIVTFFTDQLYFDYTSTKLSALIFFKVSFLVIVLVLWYALFHLFWAYRYKNSLAKKIVLYTAIYGSIMLIFMLIFWPGNWVADDLTTALMARTMQLDAWHQILSSFWCIYALMLLPSLPGIIIVQNIYISFIVGYLIAKIDLLFLQGRPLRHLCCILLYIPFLLPVTIVYNFNSIRNVPCAYTELLLLSLLVFAFFEKQPLSFKKQVVIVFFTIVTACWRAECIYYIVAVPILLLFLGKNKLTQIRVGILTAVIVAGYFMTVQYNSSLLDSSNYEVLAVLNPAVNLVRVADEGKDQAELNSIERVISVAIAKKYPDLPGNALYDVEGFLKPGYTEEDFRAYTDGVVHLALKYPLAFLYERFQVFWTSVYHLENSIESNVLVYVSSQYFDDIDGSVATSLYDARGGNELPKPLNTALRRETIQFLGCVNSEIVPQAGFRLFWNALIPIAFLILSLLALLVRKKWFLALTCFFCLCKLPLIFLGAPDEYFTYYFQLYLQGVVCMGVSAGLIAQALGSQQTQNRIFPGVAWCIALAVVVSCGKVVDNIQIQLEEKSFEENADVVIQAGTFSTDLIDLSAGAGSVDSVSTYTVRADGTLLLDGWAADWNTQTAPETVIVVCEDKIIPAYLSWYERAPLAEHFQMPGLKNAGWQLAIYAKDIPQGVIELQVYGKNHNGTFSPISSEKPIAITVAK